MSDWTHWTGDWSPIYNTPPPCPHYMPPYPVDGQPSAYHNQYPPPPPSLHHAPDMMQTPDSYYEAPSAYSPFHNHQALSPLQPSHDMMLTPDYYSYQTPPPSHSPFLSSHLHSSVSPCHHATVKEEKEIKRRKRKLPEWDGVMKKDHQLHPQPNGNKPVWLFLLELLVDPSKKEIISWTGNGREFKIVDTEAFRQLWGEYNERPKVKWESIERLFRGLYGTVLLPIPTAKHKGRNVKGVYQFVTEISHHLNWSEEELESYIKQHAVCSAKQNQDHEKVQTLQTEIAQLDSKADELDKTKAGDIIAVDWINERNRNTMKEQFLEKKKINGFSSKEDDPFTTKSGKMRVVSGSAKNLAALDDDAVNAGVSASSFISNISTPVVAKIVPIAVPTPSTVDLFSFHSFNVNTELTLTSLRTPVTDDAHRITHPISTPTSQGRPLSLADYKKRKMEAKTPQG